MYTIDAMSNYGIRLIKRGIIEQKEFENEDDAWDYVGYLDEKYPQGHFVVIKQEN